MAKKENFDHILRQEVGRCKTCQFWKDAKLQDGKLVADCRWGPPIPVMIPQQHPTTGQVALANVSIVPKTGSDFWCFRYEERVVLDG